jgi:hypothetical protein
MPDFTPVSQQLNTGDVFGTLNNVLGLQQKRQALLVQGQELEQKELQTQQMEGYNYFAKNFDVWDAKDPDTGLLSLDRAMSQDAFRNAGVGKPVALAKLNEAIKGERENANLLTQRNVTQLTTGQTLLDGLLQDPRVAGGTKEGVDFVRGYIPVLGKILGPGSEPILQAMNSGLDHMKPEDLPTAIRSHQMMILNAKDQVTAQAPTATPVLDDSGKVHYRNTNPLSPTVPVGGVLPGSEGYEPGTEPQITTGPTGETVRVAPGKGTMSAVAAPPGLNIDYKHKIAGTTAATGISTRVQQAQEQSNNTIQAQDALNRAFTILDSPAAPETGEYAGQVKDLRNALASLGIHTKETDDINTLSKNLARFEATRATAIGLGGTDAARDLAHNGSPNIKVEHNALKGMVTQSLAIEKATAAYSKAQAKSLNDPDKMQENETQFKNIPHLIEGYEYGLARNPAEADAFLKKHNLTKAQMAITRQQIKAFESQ